MGLTPTNVIIARALQEYGAYVGDFSGAISLYAENGPEAQAAWNAACSTSRTSAPSSIRPVCRTSAFLEIGALLDNDN